MLDTEGYVWVMGANESNILGIDEIQIKKPTKVTYLPEIVKISLSSNHSLLVDINGTLWVSANDTTTSGYPKADD